MQGLLSGGPDKNGVGLVGVSWLIGLWISNWLRVLKGLQNPRVKQKVTYLYRCCIVVLFFNLPKKG